MEFLQEFEGEGIGHILVPAGKAEVEHAGDHGDVVAYQVGVGALENIYLAGMLKLDWGVVFFVAVEHVAVVFAVDVAVNWYEIKGCRHRFFRIMYFWWKLSFNI